MLSPSIPPLLAEPAPPVAVSQEAFMLDADDLSETTLWGYCVRYRHEHRPQDEVVVAASFNVPASPDTGIAADAPARFGYRVSVQVDYSDDGEHIEALRLVGDEDVPATAGAWPAVEYRSSSGAVDLGSGTREGGARTYAFDPPVPAEPWPEIGLTWSGLDTAHAQNARASLAAVRNRHADAGADAIYRTTTVDMATTVAPLNRRPDDIDIGDCGDTVEAALAAVFDVLFGDRAVGQRVSIGLNYGYSPVPDGALGDEQRAAFMVWLPVGLLADGRVAATTAHEIAATLAAWKDANNPPTTCGAWAFSLVQYSLVDAETPRPLLDLGRLVYRLR